jgi:superfamily I DNA/RNA helicase
MLSQTVTREQVINIVHAKMEFVPSEEQILIILGVLNGNNNIAVNANAGTGKTTVAEMLCNVILHFNKRAKIGYMAFNRHSVDEAKEKLPKEVHIFTSHQLGMSVLREHRDFGWYNIDNSDNALKFALKDMDLDKEFAKYANLYMLYNVSTEEFINVLQEYFGHGPENAKYYAEMAAKVVNHLTIKTANASKKWVTFTQMLYLPVYFNLKLSANKYIGNKAENQIYSGKYDYLFIDEYQDTANVTTNLTHALNFDKCAFFGQKEQAIFGFAGSNHMSTENLIKEYNCIVYELKQTRRCTRQICEYINAFNVVRNGTIESLNDRIWSEKEGEPVQNYNLDQMYSWIDLNRNNIEKLKNTTVITRKTAYAIEVFMSLLSNKISAHIKGVDLIELVTIVVDWLETIGKDWNVITTYIAEYRRRMFLKKDDPDKVRFIEIETFDDWTQSFVRLLDEANRQKMGETKAQFMTFLEKFVQSENGVCVSVAHRTKGAQYKYVFVYAIDEWPYAFKEQTNAQYEQEINLLYVTLSRAMDELFVVRIK